LFYNTLPERWPRERDRARRLRVRPLHVGEAAFDAAILVGRVKWAVTLANELVFVPKFVRYDEFAHTVLTRGGPVLAAGEAELAGSEGHYWLIEITYHSGHYLPDADSLNIGLAAFARAGIEQL
jgi:hypothetical protein